MNKVLQFSNNARKQLLKGVLDLSDAVTATLGPNGRNVIIEQDGGNPISTKDGVTVAKSINFKDRFVNTGAQLVKQAAIKTADQAGDGTTTSTLLASELYQQGLEVIEKANAVEVKRGIDHATKVVVDILREMSTEIKHEDQLKNVATISANNDLEVGELIATAMEKVGLEGVITAEESKTGETFLETVEGMQFDRGFKSPYFVTDNNTMTAVLENPYILITDKKITTAKELLPLLESISTQNKSLLIIADDIDGEALSLLVVNKMKGIVRTVAVKAPDFGDRKKAILEDIATLTGGEVISAEKGMKLDKLNFDWLGKARKITVNKGTTTLVDGKGVEVDIQERVSNLKIQIEAATSSFEKENLQNRLARLVGGVAIVHVGGMTEVEMKEKKDRVEDALHATRAALEEGILPGGGVAFLRAIPLLRKYISTHEDELTVDRIKGFNIVIRALEAPFRKILTNAGEDLLGVELKLRSIVENITDKWTGYNPRTGGFVDMLESGIVDPAKVTRLALENAASVAGTLLITECVIVSDDKDDKPEDNMQFGGF